MTVLDAYGVIAYLKNEPAAEEVQPLLQSGNARLTAVGLAEVLDHLVRLVGVDEEDATLDLAQLGLLDAIPVSPAIGANAGRLRARHYHRIRRPVSLADCIAAETARARAEPLATSDGPLLDLCRDEQIVSTVLIQSDGSRWA